MASTREIIGSISAGTLSTLIGHPLDTIKVHQQNQSNESRLNGLQTAKRIFVRGSNNPAVFFNGISPPLLNQILMNTVMFSVFFQVKSWSFWNDYSDSSTAGGCIGAFGAGLISGFATACLSTPTDWIKIQAQLQETQVSNISGNKAKSGSVGIVRDLLRENKNHLGKATRILYRGHAANLGREGIFTMVYLGLYDRIMNVLNEGQSKPGLEYVVAVSAFTGALAWVSSYPFDTVKSVIQAKSSRGVATSYSSTVRHVWLQGGVSSFYRGCRTSTVRAILVTSIRMLAYEWTLRFF